MSHRTIDSIDSCTFQLHSWRPFHFQNLDSDPPKPHPTRSLTKRPCLSNRSTSFSIDLSKLSLVDDDKSTAAAAVPNSYKRPSFRIFERKRRRRPGSRSVSGRSSDRSGTRRCCSVGASAAHGTCSDLPLAVGTDSSGELFGNGDANWASDVSEVKTSWRKEREERESMIVGAGQFGNFDHQVNESGYGSEPGYRGDAEFGYGDEVDEEEEDPRMLFWGNRFGGSTSHLSLLPFVFINCLFFFLSEVVYWLRFVYGFDTITKFSLFYKLGVRRRETDEENLRTHHFVLGLSLRTDF
ncbi:hypothetical protein K2173_026230 [Erythroxylum novogranatense]|uniref:Uncharacterized protein n=1 Tax=Erythroxylum novogranatense TaxID=1862640 RepID=A0AAV8SC39_9ROSI|nr:hypothetical protein K2173_026230 [Erythroxylum novogranatense]